MQILIDRIRLGDPSYREEFIAWVRDVDYAACRDLPSVLRFHVYEAAEGADCDFFEIVHVSSLADFERDMQLPLFRSLQERFGRMATVASQLAGMPVPPGFERNT